jgi:hypothetical protein
VLTDVGSIAAARGNPKFNIESRALSYDGTLRTCIPRRRR